MLFLLTTVHVSLVLYAVYVVNGSIKVTQARETIAMVTVGDKHFIIETLLKLLLCRDFWET